MTNPVRPPLFLVSACLIGLCTRYDGAIKPSSECSKFLEERFWIPICPEQLGGLATPRPAADIIGGDGDDVLCGRARVITRTGEDVTAPFIKGAEQVLLLARRQQPDGICLKSGSPSCGASGTVGVTAALLAENGYTLYEF